MVLDFEWGEKIRVLLDIGCTDSSFGAALLDKDVLTLSLGLNDDPVDLAQVALERGFPAIVSPLGTRRLPFPGGVFDAIHCGKCSIPWFSNGGNLLLEMNRILRPGGYFILSLGYNFINQVEALSTLAASICWETVAHDTVGIHELDLTIFQKLQSKDKCKSRGKKDPRPPPCEEDERPDTAWYTQMKTCLHAVPAVTGQRGTKWPKEWPMRLETFPEWFGNKEILVADSMHWKTVVEKSYLTEMGINWLYVHNVMDLSATYGGFAAALVPHKAWVMNVVPVHASDTLSIIFERGLVGIYHDWCEAFGTYPRSYDLIHVDHLFSSVENRCEQPVGIVVEMDRILRPGGWAIIREKSEILDHLEIVLRSLHWSIRVRHTEENDEGVMCAQKTTWRP
ncbi:hypothetical protein Syun_005042 [Stephania yunnanensis]|uniref:Methyltransferase n=1 Tax=Stephania yunnanensis TaxID=152371 RepID=A0AAP0Q1Y8_9MAGN